MKKTFITKLIIVLTCFFVSGLAQQTPQLPEPNWNAFPAPIVNVKITKVAEYPIDTSLTQFQSLKREIKTDTFIIGDHVIFANDKTVYRVTDGKKRSLEFPEPLYRVITDWQNRLFVITQKRWVYIYEINTLKQLAKFQVKYNQNMSEFAYLPNDVILVGFEFWVGEGRKIRNPIAATAYDMNGKEIWNIKNSLNNNPADSDHFDYEFGVLQIGTRGFIANCCNGLKDDVQEGFVYESKTGKLKIKNVSYKTPSGAYFDGRTVNLDDSDTYYGLGIRSSIIDLYNFKYVSTSKSANPNEKPSNLEPNCLSESIDSSNFLTKIYILSSIYNQDCGGKLYFYDIKSQKYLKWKKSEICMIEGGEMNSRSSNISTKIIKNTFYYIDPFTFSISKVINGEISNVCIFNFDREIYKILDWKTTKLSTNTWSNNSFSLKIDNRTSQDNARKNTLVYSTKLEAFVRANVTNYSFIQGDNLIEIQGNLNFYKYEVVK